jgi:formate/nitrite transporter FocA (FNT family)
MNHKELESDTDSLTDPSRVSGVAFIASGLGCFVLNHAIVTLFSRLYPVLPLIGGVAFGIGLLFTIAPGYIKHLRPNEQRTTKHEVVVGLTVLCGVLLGVSVWVLAYNTKDTLAFRHFIRGLF